MPRSWTAGEAHVPDGMDGGRRRAADSHESGRVNLVLVTKWRVTGYPVGDVDDEWQGQGDGPRRRGAPSPGAEPVVPPCRPSLNEALHASGIGLWAYDTRNGSIEWDARTREIFGVDRAPENLSTYMQLVHPEDRARLRAHVAAAIQTARYPDIMHRIIRGDGQIVWVQAHASVVTDEAGQPSQLLGALIDVTEQRQVEAQRVQAQKSEAVAQLTAGVAHNFNNLLMAMLPNIELSMTHATGEDREMLQDALEAGRDAAKMVRQLMIFSGRQPTEPARRRRAGDILERAIELHLSSPLGGAEIVRRVGADTLAVNARSDQLEQALGNLITNAVDAVRGRPDATVSVDVGRVVAAHPETGDRRAWVRFAVTDAGSGMCGETLSRAFEPFYTTKGVGLGVGLGLTTAYAIAREHGGWVRIESSGSERGTPGTCVAMLVPELDGPVETADEPAPRPARARRRVLVVDDEPAVRRVVSRMLHSAGHDVVDRGDGTSAVALAAQDPNIGLVLLDVAMPDRSGREVLADLRKAAPQVRVVYFTGDAREVPDAAEADGLLHKPVSRDALVELVNRMLDLGPPERA